jgi:hypothetical protein
MTEASFRRVLANAPKLPSELEFEEADRGRWEASPCRAPEIAYIEGV